MKRRSGTTRRRVVHRSRRSRGIAMMLVIITMGMVTVLSMSYLQSQATVTGIAENVRRSSEARAIAETGLDLAVDFIRDTPDWRDKLINGVWLENTPYANGFFQVTGIDPFDGDLADNVTDMAMVTSVGYVDGVTHTCRASVRPRDIRVAHWKMNDPAPPNVTDTIGGHNGVTINGPRFLQPGVYGAGMYFDGDDCIRIPNSPEFENRNGTVALWFKTTTVGVAQGLFSRDSCGNNDGHFMLWTEPGAVGVRIQRGGSSYAIMQGGIQINRWYHVAATFGSNGVKFYLDGVLIGTDPFTGGMDGNTLDVLLGATSFTNCNGDPQWHLRGWLDDVRVYSEQLTAAEIALLAQVPAVTGPIIGRWTLDETSGGTVSDIIGGQDGMYNNVNLNAAGQQGRAVEFYGTMDSYARIPHKNDYLLDEGSVFLYFKPLQLVGEMGLFCKDFNGSGTGGYILACIRDNNMLYFRMQHAAMPADQYRIICGPLNINTWYELLCTWGPDGMKVYIDGVERGSLAYTGGTGTTAGGIGNYEDIVFGLGTWQTYTNSFVDGDPGPMWPFRGYLDDVRIFNKQITPAQIDELTYAEPDDPIFTRTTVKYEID